MKTLQVCGAELNYIESGKLHGIPIVLVHAFPLNQSMWSEQVNALKDFHVITFDIRGLGQSKSDLPYTLEFVVDDLITLLDHLKIEKVILGGLSMGGYVALRAVERNPEHFMGLILADTKSDADSQEAKLGRYRALKVIQEHGLSNYIDSFIKTALAPYADAKRISQVKEIANASSAKGVSLALLALTSRTDTTSSLGKIRIPTLILQGELDTVISLAEAQSLNNQIKDSTFVVIPKAGHLSNLENPTVFIEHVNRFIKTNYLDKQS